MSNGSRPSLLSLYSACDGQPDHPECVDAYQKACEKVRAAGKRMIGDVIESVDIFAAVYGADKAFLEKHGRKCGLHF